MDYIINDNPVHALAQGGVGETDPVLVFLHGAGMSHEVWSPLLSSLGDGPAALAPDLPGHGRSGGPLLPDIAAMAEWLEGLLATAGIARACLVGHSMGALVALEAAARFPGRICGLALVAVAETMPVHPKLLVAAKEGNPQAVEMIVEWGHAPQEGQDGVQPAEAKKTRGLLAQAVPAVLYNDLAACNDYRQAGQTAIRVACPTLLILGSEDRMAPAKAGRKLLEHLPNAQACQVTGGGHMLMLERPRDVAQALRRGLPECFRKSAPEAS